MRSGLLALAAHRVPRPEAGESAAGRRGPPQAHRLRLRQAVAKRQRAHLHALWHARVLGARGGAQRRPLAHVRLVDAGRHRLRAAHRLAALLPRGSGARLREDTRRPRAHPVARVSRHARQGPRAPLAHRRSEQATRRQLAHSSRLCGLLLHVVVGGSRQAASSC